MALSKVPLYEGALETMAMGIESSLQAGGIGSAFASLVPLQGG